MIEAPGIHPRDLLSAYLDGELPESDRTGVEEHLSGCPGCRALLEDFRAMAAAAAREPPPPFPSDLPARIRGRVASGSWKRDARRRGHGLWSYRLAWATAAGVVVITGLYAVRRGMAPASAPPPAPQATSSRIEARGGMSPLKEATPPGAIAREHAEAPGRPLPPPAAVREEAKTAMAPQPAAAGGRPARVLLFNYPTHRISVFEDGTVAVSAEGYSCSARSDAPSGDPDIASLFALASPGGGQPAAAQGIEPKDAPAVRLADVPAVAGRDIEGAPGSDLPAGKRAEVERRLMSLMHDRYLALLEERCGPAPASLRSP